MWADKYGWLFDSSICLLMWLFYLFGTLNLTVIVYKTKRFCKWSVLRSRWRVEIKKLSLVESWFFFFLPVKKWTEKNFFILKGNVLFNYTFPERELTKIKMYFFRSLLIETFCFLLGAIAGIHRNAFIKITKYTQHCKLSENSKCFFYFQFHNHRMSFHSSCFSSVFLFRPLISTLVN